MPSSNPETIVVAIKLVWELAPKSVLDVGAGYGKYGVLFREYLEMKHTASVHGEPRARGSTIWNKRVVRIDAVEPFPEYVGPLHKVVYDNIYMEEIADYLKRDWKYDFIFLGDVMEHVEKKVAVTQIIPLLVQRAKMGVLISVPVHVSEQSAEFGNEFEVHRSKWRVSDFIGLAPFVYSGTKGNHLISFLTRQIEYYSVARWSPLRRKVRGIKYALRDAW